MIAEHVLRSTTADSAANAADLARAADTDAAVADAARLAACA